jgi:hypothetical protein
MPDGCAAAADAAARVASLFKMMDVSRHKSVDVLRGYVRAEGAVQAIPRPVLSGCVWCHCSVLIRARWALTRDLDIETGAAKLAAEHASRSEPPNRAAAAAACAATVAETFSDTMRRHSALAIAPPADIRTKRIAITC